MTTYTDKLIEAMATGVAEHASLAFNRVSWPQLFLGDMRAALIAQLKFMIEHGPSEGMVRVAEYESDVAIYESDGRSIYIAMCRALLAELEAP